MHLFNTPWQSFLVLRLYFRLTNPEAMKIIPILLTLFFAGSLHAQRTIGKTTINGELVVMMLDDNGDTLYVANDLLTISLTSPRKFKSREEYNRYRYYLKCAAIVYPYAKESIEVFQQLNEETGQMKKRKRKKYARKLQKKLDDQFEEPLKGLTKIQGKILVKMLEKELDTPFYTLIKTYRGGLTAGYWNTLSKFWGYDLKHGYIEGEDPILDAVLQDFILTQEAQNGTGGRGAKD